MTTNTPPAEGETKVGITVTPCSYCGTPLALLSYDHGFEAGVRAGLEAAAKHYENFVLHHRKEATLSLVPQDRAHHWQEAERTQCVADQLRAIDPASVKS